MFIFTYLLPLGTLFVQHSPHSLAPARRCAHSPPTMVATMDATRHACCQTDAIACWVPCPAVLIMVAHTAPQANLPATAPCTAVHDSSNNVLLAEMSRWSDSGSSCMLQYMY